MGPASTAPALSVPTRPVATCEIEEIKIPNLNL